MAALLALGGCKRAPAPAAAPPSTPTPEMRDFCVATMKHVMSCFHEDSFWDAFATTYFAKYPDQTGDPDAKKHWIGMRKDDLVQLYRDRQFEPNCQVMLEKNQLPTEADMKSVQAAMEKPCVEFGGAFGYLLFHKGVFHAMRH
jgi:hypothetical protein